MTQFISFGHSLGILTRASVDTFDRFPTKINGHTNVKLELQITEKDLHKAH